MRRRNIGLVHGSGGDVNRVMAPPQLSILGSQKESPYFRRGRWSQRRAGRGFGF